MVSDRIDQVGGALDSGELDRRLGLPRLGITRDHCVEHEFHDELTHQPDTRVGVDLHLRQLAPRLARTLFGTAGSAQLCRVVGVLADYDLGDVAAAATDREDGR